MPVGLGMAMPGALMERKAQRGTNRACSGMVATEHCQAQDKGFGAARNSLAMGWEGEGLNFPMMLYIILSNLFFAKLTCFFKLVYVYLLY